jgi:hypothetical protein
MVDRGDAGGTAIDPSWDPQRTAYALTLRYDGLAQAGELDPAFVAMREVEGMHAMHTFLVYAVNRPMYPLPDDANQAFPLEAMNYFELDGMIRHQTEAQSPNHTQFYFDRPLIAFVHHVIARTGARITARHDFDVVESAMDADGATAAVTIHDNIVRGVIDDAIEAHVTIPNEAITTRTLLAAAPASGVSIVALQPSASASSLPIAARSAAAASLERGAIVATAGTVSIGGEPHVGWWEVDPTTGSTIGRLESGAGQALGEYLPTTSVALKAATIADIVGGFDRCMFDDASAVLAGGGGSGGVEAAADCGKEVACEFAVGQAIGQAGSLFDLGADEELNELIDQLLDLDNDLWGASKAACK